MSRTCEPDRSYIDSLTVEERMDHASGIICKYLDTIRAETPPLLSAPLPMPALPGEADRTPDPEAESLLACCPIGENK